ncbi:MAG: hypothetical protein SGCHY_002497 [Lobulomycetales sp.]
MYVEPRPRTLPAIQKDEPLHISELSHGNQSPDDSKDNLSESASLPAKTNAAEESVTESIGSINENTSIVNSTRVSEKNMPQKSVAPKVQPPSPAPTSRKIELHGTSTKLSKGQAVHKHRSDPNMPIESVIQAFIELDNRNDGKAFKAWKESKHRTTGKRDNNTPMTEIELKRALRSLSAEEAARVDPNLMEKTLVDLVKSEKAYRQWCEEKKDRHRQFLQKQASERRKKAQQQEQELLKKNETKKRESQEFRAWLQRKKEEKEKEVERLEAEKEKERQRAKAKRELGAKSFREWCRKQNESKDKVDEEEHYLKHPAPFLLPNHEGFYDNVFS